jgi:hypothetical protein
MSVESLQKTANCGRLVGGDDEEQAKQAQHMHVLFH